MDYSFKSFQKKAIIRSLELERYKQMKEDFNNSKNIGNDRNFQKKFNVFYRIRRKDSWQKSFYKYFNDHREDINIEFKDILEYMYKKEGSVEASFCSKMLATINPKMPILDRYVLKNLFNLERIPGKKETKLKNAIAIYDDLIKKMNEKLEDKKVLKTIEEIRSIVGDNYDLSEMKILDFIIWNDREEDNNSEV